MNKIMIICVFIFLSGFAFAADPGHPASDIDPGTFAEGVYTFGTSGTTVNVLGAINGESGTITKNLVAGGIITGNITVTSLNAANCDLKSDLSGFFYCGTDLSNTYTASTGLNLTGNAFSIKQTYQLPQACGVNQIPKWVGGNWVCANDDSGSGGNGWQDGGSAVYLETSTDNVGIGTNSPQEKLHVQGSVRGDQSGALRISTGTGYVDIGPQNTDWSHFVTDRANFYFNRPVYTDNGIFGAYNGNHMKLLTSNIERLKIDGPTGDVTIKENALVEKGLSVTNDVFVDGAIGVDVASPGAKVDIDAAEAGWYGGWHRGIGLTNTDAIQFDTGTTTFGMGATSSGDSLYFIVADSPAPGASGQYAMIIDNAANVEVKKDLDVQGATYLKKTTQTFYGQDSGSEHVQNLGGWDMCYMSAYEELGSQGKCQVHYEVDNDWGVNGPDVTSAGALQNWFFRVKRFSGSDAVRCKATCIRFS